MTDMILPSSTLHPQPLRPMKYVLRELALRVVQTHKVEDYGFRDCQITGPEAAVELLREVQAFSNPDIESLIVVALNHHNYAIGWTVGTVGTVDCTQATPRDVFRFAILCGASSVMVSHNHPSGQTAPSDADIQVTKALAAAGRVVGVPLWDHLIVGEKRFCQWGRGYYSFAVHGGGIR